MAPELHYQIIINRVAELQNEATTYRRVREAEKTRERGGHHRLRASLGKFRSQ
ncbi:hypothetical protein GT755_26425 [Herbidospora sp. NEAU-GS84]|uniref:Uncharacterized protein n=1 Tax=Herbidospora solisilvae TaxID=2696284 RepID=A0A7C9JEH2_9ACTN|nr:MULTISPECIES: hypothetical protein [Herbidospora]NAS25204.1 hypothetical protein [Herbidospora solisilvae]GLX96059.1 hypothetical protein Hesp01_40090 [Herbidospora sp. NBRC 101105]